MIKVAWYSTWNLISTKWSLDIFRNSQVSVYSIDSASVNTCAWHIWAHTCLIQFRRTHTSQTMDNSVWKKNEWIRRKPIVLKMSSTLARKTIVQHMASFVDRISSINNKAIFLTSKLASPQDTLCIIFLTSGYWHFVILQLYLFCSFYTNHQSLV